MSVCIDKDSIIQVSEDLVKSCQKFSYVKATYLGSSPKPVKELISWRIWNCDEAKYNDLQVTFRYADGTREKETYQYALWRYVKQGSPEYDLFEYVCTHE